MGKRLLTCTPLDRRPLLIVCVLGLAGCDPVAPEDPDSMFEATWAAEDWLGDAEVMLYAGQDSLFVWGGSPPRLANASSPWHYYGTTIHVEVAYDGPGSYTVDSGMASVDYLLDGDVLTARYAIPDGRTGTLVIEEATATWIRGTVAFDVEPTMHSSPAGESARFEGTFEAPLTRP